MESFTKESGKATPATGMEFRSGPMVLDTTGNGNLVRLLVKANLLMLTEIFMRANGRMIRQVDTGLICIITGPNIKENGSMTFSMARELKLGLTEVLIMEVIMRERNMDRVNIPGKMAAIMMEAGLKIKLLDLGSMFGRMAEDIRVSG